MTKSWAALVATISLVAWTRGAAAQPGAESVPAEDEVGDAPPLPPPVEAPTEPAPTVYVAAPVVAAPVVAPLVVVPPPSTVPDGVLEDANSGRNWLTPTALMPPKGTFTFSDFELFIIGASYAITDDFQISASTFLPITSDMPFLGMASAKFRILQSGRVHLAGQGTVLHYSDGDDSATAFTLGGALTVCLDPQCHSYASGYVGAGFAHEDESAVPIGVSGTIVARVARHVKLMVEADSGGVIGNISAAADGFLAWYGVRFTSRNIGVDFGFLKPICNECGSDELPLGVPFLAFSYRAI